MDIDRVTVIEPESGVRLSSSDVVVRSVTPSKGSLVFEVPRDAFEGLSSDGRPNDEAGCAIVITTAQGRTYDGYVEMAVDGDGTRFYWCGIGF